MNFRLRSNQTLGKALDLEQKGRHREALAKARLAVGQDPTNTMARHALALLLIREGKLGEAEQELAAIIKQNPHHEASWSDLSELLFKQERFRDYEALMERLETDAPEIIKLRTQFGRYLITNRRFPEAERSLCSVLLLDPHNDSAHWYLGLIHQARGRLSWAIKEFREALSSDIHDKNIILDLCSAYLELGETNKALQELRRLRFIYTRDPEVSSLLASTILDQGEVQEAFDILLSIKARHPDDPMSYVYLAEAEAELGHVDKAHSYLITAEHLNFEADVWSRIGQVYEFMDEYTLARSAYEKALETAPRVIEHFVNLTNILEEMDQTADAMKILRQGLKINPRDAELHYLLGNLLADEGEFFEARIHFEQALRFDYEYLDAYLALGVLILEQMSLADRAAEVFETGLLWGDSEPLRSNYAEALRELGRFAEAEAILRKMLEVNPENPSVLVQLGNLLFESNRRVEARAFFEKAMELEPEWSFPYHGLGCCFLEEGQRELGVDYLRLAATMGSEPSIDLLTELGEWRGDHGEEDGKV